MAYTSVLGSFTCRIDDWASRASEKCMCSMTFDVGGIDWFLCLYPRGETETSSEHLAMFLHCKNEAGKLEKLHNCCFSLILRATGATELRQRASEKCSFSPSSTAWGFRDFLKLTALSDASRGFIKDGALTIVAELEVRLHAPSRHPAPPAAEGYDDKLFLVQPVTASPCSICLCVMNDPVNCPQGHNFCRACLTTWLSKQAQKVCPTCRSRVVQPLVPNRFAADVISALALRCPTAAAATSLPPKARCIWTGPVRDLAAHRGVCIAELVPCNWCLCSKLVHRGEAESHAAKCGRRSEFCEHCSEVLRGSAAINRHKKECAAAPVQCTNAGCSKRVAQDAMDAHRAECPFAMLPCAVLGCSAVVLRNAVAAHMTTDGAHVQTLSGQLQALTKRLEDTLRKWSCAESPLCRLPQSRRREAASAPSGKHHGVR